MTAPRDKWVAVVGHGGFLGPPVCRHLERAGHNVLRVGRGNAIEGMDPDRVRKITTVIWLANSITPAVAETAPDMIRADAEALQRCTDAMEKWASHARLVLASSGGTIYSDTTPPYSEQSPAQPATAYGQAKLDLERHAMASLPHTCVLRISNPYGPGQLGKRQQGVIGAWFSAVRDGRPATMIGDPETARDYIFVDDVAQAIVRATEASSTPPIVNIGAGAPTSLGRLAGLIAETVAPVPFRVDQRDARSFDRLKVWLDVSLAEASLGWRPTTALGRGLELTWRSFGDDRSR